MVEKSQNKKPETLERDSPFSLNLSLHGGKFWMRFDVRGEPQTCEELPDMPSVMKALEEKYIKFWRKMFE